MKIICKTWVYILGALWVSNVYATILEITPVQLSLAPNKRIGVLKVTNRGNETSLLQLSLFDWKQSPNGKDSYKISHDILLTPRCLRCLHIKLRLYVLR